MTDTLTIADTMTATDLLTGIINLRQKLAKSGTVSLAVGSDDTSPATLLVRPEGYGGGECQIIYGKSWPEVFESARQWIEARKVTFRDSTIRKMALAVIELTDEHGKCTEAMLKRRQFSVEQIAEFHEAACQRANEMCQGAPFRVEFV